MKKLLSMSLLCAFVLASVSCSGNDHKRRDDRRERRDDRGRCKRCPKCLTLLDEVQSNAVAVEASK